MWARGESKGVAWGGLRLGAVLRWPRPPRQEANEAGNDDQ